MLNLLGELFPSLSLIDYGEVVDRLPTSEEQESKCSMQNFGGPWLGHEGLPARLAHP